DLERGARSRIERAEACRLCVAMHVAGERPVDALRAGARGLAELGIVVPDGDDERRTALKREISAIEACLRSQPVHTLLGLPIVRDPEIAAAMGVLVDLFAPAFLVSPTAAGLVTAVLVHMSIVHGNTEASAYAYAAYGLFLATTMGRPDDG